jgi:hypothetical protein
VNFLLRNLTSFENFTRKLEEALGRFDAKIIADLSKTPEMLENAIMKREGYPNAMDCDAHCTITYSIYRETAAYFETYV